MRCVIVLLSQYDDDDDDDDIAMHFTTLCSKKTWPYFLMISWSRTVRLERFLAELLLRV